MGFESPDFTVGGRISGAPMPLNEPSKRASNITTPTRV